jgi:hypothetical protein
MIMTDLIQLIYVSQPFGFDAPTLNGILLDARRNNARDAITGALICRHDIYLQLLEGPAEKVQHAYARIARDDRHIGMKTLVSKPISERIFGDWDMLHDPAQSWIWTEAEMAEGVIDRATPQDVTDMFESLARKAAEQNL